MASAKKNPVLVIVRLQHKAQKKEKENYPKLMRTFYSNFASDMWVPQNHIYFFYKLEYVVEIFRKNGGFGKMGEARYFSCFE